MDMGAKFVAATRWAAPQAKIVRDRFHISQHFNQAVDLGRRAEHKRLSAEGDNSLAGTKYDWLRRTSNEGESVLAFDEVCERELKTANAWIWKEFFVEFWHQPDALRAHPFFKDWCAQVMRSRIEPIEQVARTLERHPAGLLPYFEYPITNAVAGGFNSLKPSKARSRHPWFRQLPQYNALVLRQARPRSQPFCLSCFWGCQLDNQKKLKNKPLRSNLRTELTIAVRKKNDQQTTFQSTNPL